MINKNCGIYLIYCKSNKKIYIGSSNDIKMRWINHRSSLNNGRHNNIYLQSSWEKYGSKVFIWKIVEICSPNKLLVMERKWFKKTKCCNRRYGFNVVVYPLSPMKGRKHTKETKQKIGKANKGKKVSKITKQRTSMSLMGHKVSKITRYKLSQYKGRPNLKNRDKKLTIKQKRHLSKINTGKKHSKTTKRKMSLSHKGMVFTKEHKNNISLSNKGRKVSEKTRQKISKSLKKFWKRSRSRTK